MSEALAFLLWLVFVGISAIIIGYFLKYYAFNDNVIKEEFVVYGCPSGTTNYITDIGETNCCNGDVVDGECNGNNVCTLSPNNTAGLPACAEIHAKAAAAAAIAKCPEKIPNYFAALDGSLKGCSVSNIMSDGSAPMDTSALQCILYSTAELDSSKLDSCQNYIANQLALSAVKTSCATLSSSSRSSGTAGNTSASSSSVKLSQLSFLGDKASANLPSITAPVARVAQIAKMAQMAPVAPLAPVAPVAPVAPAASANPTGYVMYGDRISGNLAVTKIIDGPAHEPSKGLLAQDGKYIRIAITDPTISYKIASFVAEGDISSITQFGSLDRLQNLNRVEFNVKKADGSAPLPPPPPPAKAIPPSSTNPNDYILTGGNPPVSNLQVSKILADDYRFYFFAQNGNNINYVILKPSKSNFVYLGSGLTEGKIAEITDEKSFNLLTQKGALGGSGYIAKKKDGSETYAP